MLGWEFVSAIRHLEPIEYFQPYCYRSMMISQKYFTWMIRLKVPSILFTGNYIIPTDRKI